MKSKNSPVSKTLYDGLPLYVKRDDLLHHEFSGNKARKFHYFLEHDFEDIDKIISYGSAQANSLYSLSVLSKMKGVKLDFYVYKMADFLKQNPSGNYKEALKNSANIIELDYEIDKLSYIKNEILPREKNAVFIQEGGRVQEAQVGIKILADEIIQWADKNSLSHLKIVLPSGTGTTALFLQKFVPFEVLTVACVGDDAYLKAQFKELNTNEKEHPTIISMEKKYHFGKLYKVFYETYLDVLEQTQIEFDLLYDPLGFMALKQYIQSQSKENTSSILYVHQGGLLGNPSMLERYKRKYPTMAK